MHDAEHAGEDRARDDAEQHRDIGDEAGAPFDQAENDQQHEQRDAEPLQLTIAGIGEGAGDTVDHFGQGRQASAGPVDTYSHQRDADGGATSISSGIDGFAFMKSTQSG